MNDNFQSILPSEFNFANNRVFLFLDKLTCHFKVKNEVQTQLWRLVSHPSIIVLAGNNENEAALATNWWKISADQMPDYYNQFRDLYIGTIRETILDEGIMLPFVSSSPTNGIERMGFKLKIFLIKEIISLGFKFSFSNPHVVKKKVGSQKIHMIRTLVIFTFTTILQIVWTGKLFQTLDSPLNSDIRTLAFILFYIF